MDNSHEMSAPGVLPRGAFNPYQQALIIILMLGAISTLNILLENIIQPSSLVFIYLIATIISAFFCGTWPAILASSGGLLLFDFLFVEPKYKFSMYHTQDIYNVIVYFIMAIMIIKLVRVVQKQNLIVRFRLDRAAFIEDMSRDFLRLTPIEKTSAAEMLRVDALNVTGKIIVQYTKKIIDVPVFVCFREMSGNIRVWAKSEPDMEPEKEDLDGALWTFLEGTLSGAGVKPDSKSGFFFIPLESHEQSIGVLAVKYDYSKLSPEQHSLLRSLSNMGSMAAERWIKS